MTARRSLKEQGVWALLAGTLLVLAAPGAAWARDCPPQAPYTADVQDKLDGCPMWSCSVTYDPADGYMPEEDPVAAWTRS